MAERSSTEEGCRELGRSADFALHACSGSRRVLGFLVAKGLLVSPSVSPAGGVKLTIGDCLLVAEEVEPRILAVLPAALIHFPRSFLDYHEMPKVLRAIIDAILAGKEDGPGLGMIEFVELRRWAYASLKDGRAKPLAERKVRRTYRLKPRVAELLAEKASAGHTTETAIIESLVESTLSGGE